MILVKSVIDKTLSVEIKSENKSLKNIILEKDLEQHDYFILKNNFEFKNLDYIPNDEDLIEIYIKPSGGKGTFNSILTLAVGVASGGLIGGGISSLLGGGALGSFASTVTKSLVLGFVTSNPVVKPAKPVSSEFSEDPRNYTLTGTNNKSNPFGPVPKVFGKTKIYPYLGATPYTEIVGNEQYLRMLFLLGYGRLNVANIKIGNTAIDSYSDNIEYNVLEGYSGDNPLTLFTQDINQVSVNSELPWNTTTVFVERTTGVGIDETIIDLSCPEGLFGVSNLNPKQTKEPGEFFSYVSYRLNGSSTWLSAIDIIDQFSEAATINAVDSEKCEIKFTDKTTSHVFKFFKLKFPTNGQYDIRLGRSNIDFYPLFTVKTKTYWDNMKDVTYENPVDLENMALIELRIKATDQLNGTIDDLNCIVESYLPIWNGSVWTDTITRNPAWAYCDVLRSVANKKAITDNNRFDLDKILELETFCDTEGFNFDFYMDGRTNVSDALDIILAVCRSQKTVVDGQYSVIIDQVNNNPITTLTNKNIISFSGAKKFTSKIHALKCYFKNEDEDYEQDERIVYNDGYTKLNATKIEDYRVPGIVNTDHIWKDGRYWLAVNTLRPNVYLYRVDIRQLVIDRGSRIETSVDEISVGISRDFIKSWTLSGNLVTSITVAENCPMITGTSYAINIERSNGVSQEFPIDTVDGDNTTLLITTPFDITVFPIVKGNSMAFGEAGKVTRSLIVTAIKYSKNLEADIECVDYDADIYTADTGTIPTFTSNITETYEERKEIPPIPILARIASGSYVLKIDTNNKFKTRILVDLKPDNKRSIQAQYYQARFRKTGENDNWEYISEVRADAAKVEIPDVDNGIQYNIEIRSRYENNISDWLVLDPYTVIGVDIPPDQVSGLTSDFTTNNLILNWVHVKEFETDLDYYKIKRASTDVGYDSADDFFETPKNTITIDLFIENGAGGTDSYYYYIKAIDQAGNESATATSFGLVEYLGELKTPVSIIPFQNISYLESKSSSEPDQTGFIKENKGFIADNSGTSTKLCISKKFIKKGISVEKSTANLLTEGQSLFTTSWTKVGTLSDTLFATGGINNLPYAKLTRDATSGNEYYLSKVLALGHMFSVYMKGDNGGESVTVRLSTDTSKDLTIDLTNEWKRYWITAATTIGTIQVNILLNDINTSINVCMAQVELSNYPTSFVYGGTTRPTGKYSMSTDLISKDFGTIEFIFEPNFLYNTTSNHYFLDTRKTGSASNYILFYYSTSDKFVLELNDGINPAIILFSQQFDDGTTYDNINSEIIAQINYSSTKLELIVNGETRDSETQTIDLTTIWNEFITIGSSYIFALNSDSVLKSLKFYSEILSTSFAANKWNNKEKIIVDNNSINIGNTIISEDDFLMSADDDSIKINKKEGLITVSDPDTGDLLILFGRNAVEGNTTGISIFSGIIKLSEQVGVYDEIEVLIDSAGSFRIRDVDEDETIVQIGGADPSGFSNNETAIFKSRYDAIDGGATSGMQGSVLLVENNHFRGGTTIKNGYMATFKNNKTANIDRGVLINQTGRGKALLIGQVCDATSAATLALPYFNNTVPTADIAPGDVFLKWDGVNMTLWAEKPTGGFQQL
jgi:hypothetical protein